MLETAKNLLYNRNYYLSEATNLVNTQFGSNTWTTEYTTLDQILNDTVHDIVTTNTLDKKTVMYITVNSASSNFTIGETVTGGTTNATGKVLEWSADDQALYAEVYTGTFNNVSETLTDLLLVLHLQLMQHLFLLITITISVMLRLSEVLLHLDLIFRALYLVQTSG